MEKDSMLKVNFYEQTEDSNLKFAVIIATSNGKWVFCKHKDRDTLEVPGGRRESGESILETAKRELREETGAVCFRIQPVCVYSVSGKGRVDKSSDEESYGMLFVADITEFEELHSEIEKIVITDKLAEHWTYPLIQPFLLKEVLERGLTGKYRYKRAALSDIGELVRTRLIVLRAANQLPDEKDLSEVEQESMEYYRNSLDTGRHIAYLVYDNDTFVGAGGVSFYQVMPTYHNPSGKKAYIMNLYTAPEYRRQGIAFRTLDLLVQEARIKGIAQISLEATEIGRPLYEKYGFVKAEEEMELH